MTLDLRQALPQIREEPEQIQLLLGTPLYRDRKCWFICKRPRATVGIALCWDVLLRIAGRIGQDWEPVDTCVADIADYWASSIDYPGAIELLDPESVAEYFSDPENWKSGEAK